MTTDKPTPASAPEEKPKPAGHPRAFPTLWHRAQIAFPWGRSTRPRKRPTREPQPPRDLTEATS